MASLRALQALRLFVAVGSPAYVHPDELFQSQEIISSFLFRVKSVIPWEFSDCALPSRAILPQFITVGAPLTLVRLAQLRDSRLLTLAPRVWLWLLSLAIDGLVARLVAGGGSPARSSSAASVMFASSWVSLVLLTRPFSNTLEAFLLALLVLIVAELQARHAAGRRLWAVALGVTCALGVFTRFTFALFAAPLGLCVLLDAAVSVAAATAAFAPLVATKRGVVRRPHAAAAAIPVLQLLHMSGAFVLACLALTAADSIFFGQLTVAWVGWGLETRGVAGGSAAPLSSFFRLLPMEATGRLVVAPVNNLLYNLNPANLSLHGAHPRWQHLLVNMPLMFGPAALLLLWRALVGIVVGARGRTRQAGAAGEVAIAPSTALHVDGRLGDSSSGQAAGSVNGRVKASAPPQQKQRRLRNRLQGEHSSSTTRANRSNGRAAVAERDGSRGRRRSPSVVHIGADTSARRGNGAVAENVLPGVRPVEWNDSRQRDSASNTSLQQTTYAVVHWIGAVLGCAFVESDPQQRLRTQCRNIIVCGLAALSTAPHQEARFLAPLLLPVAVLCGGSSDCVFSLDDDRRPVARPRGLSPPALLASRLSPRRLFWAAWVLFNSLAGVFFGFLHQGGLLPAVSALGNALAPLAHSQRHRRSSGREPPSPPELGAEITGRGASLLSGLWWLPTDPSGGPLSDLVAQQSPGQSPLATIAFMETYMVPQSLLRLHSVPGPAQMQHQESSFVAPWCTGEGAEGRSSVAGATMEGITVLDFGVLPQDSAATAAEGLLRSVGDGSTILVFPEPLLVQSPLPLAELARRCVAASQLGGASPKNLVRFWPHLSMESPPCSLAGWRQQLNLVVVRC